ncbi:MAG: YggT family protein [Chloroflexota bacterium]
MDAIAIVIIQMLQIFSWVLVARAILSWIDQRQEWGISRVLADITEPIIRPVRQFVPPMGGFDISFIIVFFGIQVLIRAIRTAMIS